MSLRAVDVMTKRWANDEHTARSTRKTGQMEDSSLFFFENRVNRVSELTIYGRGIGSKLVW